MTSSQLDGQYIPSIKDFLTSEKLKIYSYSMSQYFQYLINLFVL